MSRNLYLIVSDLHITDVEEHPDGWKRYKSRRFVFDDDLAEVIGRFMTRADDGSRLTLVLNGDVFDFDFVNAIPDVPSWPISRIERRYGLYPNEEKSVWKLARILADRPGFIRMLALFAGAGHRIVYVLGNHDRELQFEAVQQVLVSAVIKSAEEEGLTLNSNEVMRFEPWFFYVPGEIFAEHGHQYDRYSSFRYILSPVVERADGTEEIAIPMGDLAGRYLLGRIGFFNPHAEEFAMSLFAYIAHWVTQYLAKGRSLLVAWLIGAHLVLFKSLATKRRVLARGPDEHDRLMRSQAERNKLPLQVVRKLDELKRQPVTDRTFRLARELWIDRLIIAALMTGGTVALALVSIPLWIKLMIPLAVFPLVYLIYEAIAAESLFEDREALTERGRKISDLLSCPVVAFGHTHMPALVPLHRGRSLVNSGTWAPTWDVPSLRLSPGHQNYALIEIGDGLIDAHIDSWTEARLGEKDGLQAITGEHTPLPHATGTLDNSSA